MLNYTCSEAIQSGIYYETGGQPGHRGAWVNAEVNANCDDFFTRTLKTLDESFVRPRYAGYLHFQDVAGNPIQKYLQEGGNPNQVLDELDAMYRKNKKENS